MVESFRVARYRFDLEAVDELRMPAYQGSTFRGGFGHAFKKMVCFRPDWGACNPCARGNDCPYGYVFETRLPQADAAPLSLHEVAPPFVIEAPSGARRVYPPGERLGFDLLLVGRGIGVQFGKSHTIARGEARECRLQAAMTGWSLLPGH